MKKNIRKLTALAVMCLMLVTLLPTMAFAETGTETDPATAYITKDLEMAEGTTTPSGTVTFKFTSVSVDGEEATAGNMPALPDATITFSSTDAGTTTGGVTHVVKQVETLTNVTWPHAGIYVYTVSELGSGFTVAAGDTMTYSNSVYRMTVVVVNGENGYYAKYVTVQLQTTGDDGEIQLGDKITPDPEPTPGAGNDFRFTNTYVKKAGQDPGGDPEDPNNPPVPDPDTYTRGLAIQKTVTGDLGDKTADFPFTITVNKPAITGANDLSCKAFIGDADGNYISGPITVTYGAKINFNLKHGQSLVFQDVYVGSTWSASETDALGHTMSQVITSGGVASPEKNLVRDTGANSQAVTNHRESTTPTGLLINNLPYIALIVVAGSSIALYFGLKRRREAEEN